MRLMCFTIRDQAVGAYLPPFYARTRGEGARSFLDACTREGSQFALHAADYTLFYVGIFDDVSGLFEPGVTPERVIGALEVLELARPG